jgi:hypothetical protein
MSVTATVQSHPITASVSGGQVSASVAASSVSATISAGVGPAGPQGQQGIPGNALSAASDVTLTGVADGDLLRYQSGKWKNYPTGQLLDGGAY